MHNKGETMRILGGLLQVVFFVVVVGASLLAAGLITNRLPFSDPPGVVSRVTRYLTSNVAETVVEAPFPELRLRQYGAPPGLLLDVARRAVQRLGWELAALDAEKLEIRAVVTSKMLRFKDDVTIRIKSSPGGGSLLWVRSASRVGKGDLGANTRHIMKLVDAVDRIAPTPGVVVQPGGGRPAESPGELPPIA
jgi:hypothetical protein